MQFQHLKKAKQNYFEHLGDAWHYSMLSLMASIAFFVHGIYPDAFQFMGSNIIQTLDYDIRQKFRAIELKNEQEKRAQHVISTPPQVPNSQQEQREEDDQQEFYRYERANNQDQDEDDDDEN